MSKITLNILNRNITLNCNDGDETKIRVVAERFNARMQDLQQGLQASDVETLIIGGIVVMDECETAIAKYDSLKSHTESQPIDSVVDSHMPLNTAEHLESAINTLEKLINSPE